MRTLLPAIVCALCCTAAAAPPATKPTLNEKCRILLEEWHDRLDGAHLTAFVSPPFVVAGDGGAERVDRYLHNTILAAAEALHRKFFDRQPTEPILILLFESDETYRHAARKWFGDEDVSRYGYFRQRDNVMLMNVSTGTGTLVHELVHALIKPDFADVPSWFNEGLGSLFEQCTLANNDIRGLENWRLPALQRAIRQNKLRPLSEMIGDDDFYNADRTGMNYAESRYLLMYLQEQGKLRDFYRRFRDAHEDDPTGSKSLEHIIAPQSFDSFEKDWRAWVLTLRFD